MKAICLWSAGKDSCFAYYKALEENHQILGLINFIDSRHKKSVSHGLSAEIIKSQAGMTGLEVLQVHLTKGEYRQGFVSLIKDWKKKKNIEAVVFGDIYLQTHKDWIDGVCKEADVVPIVPHWLKDTNLLIREFVDCGFKALIVAVNSSSLGNEWLGRQIDKSLIDELSEKGNIDLCGEKGEFHTFVYDGPIFKKPVSFSAGRKTKNSKYSFLEILPA